MSLRKFEIGETVVITDKISKYSQNTHGVKPGMSATVVGYAYQGYYQVKLESGRVINEKSTAFSKSKSKTSVEQFQEEIEKAQEMIKAAESFIVETQAKINFLAEVGSDEFNENEFKAYHTLSIIEQGNMTKIEKAKAIAALISSK
jgi:hypothetical protein